MAATIKMMKIGKRGYPIYRIVVMDKRKKRNGRYLDKIGFYDPHQTKNKLQIDQKKLAKWLANGVVISEGFQKIMPKKGLIL